MELTKLQRVILAGIPTTEWIPRMDIARNVLKRPSGIMTSHDVIMLNRLCDAGLVLCRDTVTGIVKHRFEYRRAG